MKEPLPADPYRAVAEVHLMALEWQSRALYCMPLLHCTIGIAPAHSQEFSRWRTNAPISRITGINPVRAVDGGRAANDRLGLRCKPRIASRRSMNSGESGALLN